MTDPQDIYDPRFVADLFDRCSRRYRWWSAVASFGFVWLWRRQAVGRLRGQRGVARIAGAEPAKVPYVVDLMAGTGEVWPHVLAAFPRAQIAAIDISPVMHDHAVDMLHRQNARRITHYCADALTEELPAHSADMVISTFGLKTLTPAGQDRLARQIAMTLKPGGVCALIEASDPKGWVFRGLYRFYMARVLPMIERVALRGAQDFAMIATYTQSFGDCSHMAEALRREGLVVSTQNHFFGCATSVAGFKPPPDRDKAPL